MDNGAIQEFINAIKEDPVDQNKTNSAIVSRIDTENVIWVNLAGSTKETPTSSSSSEVKVGDVVNVEWRNNRLYIVGNNSNPSAGIVRVYKAEADANIAKEAANNAKAEAERARNEADEAHRQAVRATGYANDSLSQLSIVEDVVGTLNWITTHATYKVTADTEVHAGKWYFTKSGDTYNVVVTPSGNPASQGWYEIDTIKEAVANYVKSHLALTNEGLYVTKDNQAYKILVAADGIRLYDDTGHIVSTFGENISFDASRPQRIGNNNVYIEYYDSNNDGTPDALRIKADEFLLSSGKSIFDEIEAIETWFYTVPPTNSNEPARNWTTEKLKDLHLRDIYFDTETGKSYRWALTSATGVTPKTYGWVEIEDVQYNALSGRLSTAETNISQNSQQIALKANASEVYTKSETYTKTETNSAITQKANEINLSVEEKIDGINIGGRNLVWDTEWKDVSANWSNWGSPTTREIVEVDNKRWLHLVTTTTTFQGLSQNSWKRNGYGEVQEGDVISVSCLAYASVAGRRSCIGVHWLNSSGSVIGQNWATFTLTTSKKRYTYSSWTVPADAVGFNIMVGDNTNSAQELWIADVKLEKGNKATDWTPAPEDSNAYTDSAVSAAKAEIKVTTDGISSEVSQKVGNGEVISKINQSAEAVKIQASKVEVDGNLIVGKSYVDGKANDAEANAKKVATDYVTKIDNNGIFVSPSSQNPTVNAPGNSVKINGDGMEVYKGGNSIAFYGDTARIGERSSRRIEITNSAIDLYNSANTNQLKIGAIKEDVISLANVGLRFKSFSRQGTMYYGGWQNQVASNYDDANFGANDLDDGWGGGIEFWAGGHRTSHIGYDAEFAVSHSGLIKCNTVYMRPGRLKNVQSGNAFGDDVPYDRVGPITTDYIPFGSHVVVGVLTSSASKLIFSLPTGHTLPTGTIIEGMKFNISARVGKSNGQGLYIIKRTSGGSDWAAFDLTGSSTFRNGADTSKTVTAGMVSRSLQARTSIYVEITGSGDDFFSGSSANTSIVNNQPVVMIISGLQLKFKYPAGA